MRILQIDKFFYKCEGSSRVYFDTIDGLRARGQEVAEFSMQHPKNKRSAFSRYFAPTAPELNDNLNKFEKLKVMFRRYFSGEVERRLGALISDFRPDVAHIHNSSWCLSAGILRTLHDLRVPTVLTMQEVPLPCLDLFQKFEAYYYRWRGSWKNIRLFICRSEFVANKLVENEFPKEKIRLVRNPYLLPEHVTPPDVKVANTEEEILAALSEGKIVVAAHGGGNSEIIIDGENGFIYRADDPGNLVATVARAKALPGDKVNRIVERGRQLVLRDHNPDQYFMQLMGVYEEAIK